MTRNYWPGSIPSYIRCHSTQVSLDQVKSQTKGWRLFVEERWTSQPAGASEVQYEIRQRRALMEEWALLEQSVRDTYDSRAEDSTNFSFRECMGLDESYLSDVKCYCLAPLNPRNRALWTKIRILFYDLSGEISPIINSDEIGVAIPNPSTPTLTPSHFLMWMYGETADFTNLHMLNDGTVIFSGIHQALLADQETLNTGLLLLCEFHNNGEIKDQLRVRGIDLKDIWWRINDGGEPISKFSNRCRIVCHPMNMELPILDVLESVDRNLMNNWDGDADAWAEDIETYAPGYLEMERRSGTGLVGDYDHTSFMN